MGDGISTNLNSQQSHRKPENKLDSVLEALGIKADDLQTLLEAKRLAEEIKPKEEDGDRKYFKNKTIIYEDHDAFIYQRGTSKTGRWYLRIYDDKKRQAIYKSLKTTDKVKAIDTARFLYVEIKGKLDRGERIKSINTPELIDRWQERLKSEISDIPHTGITAESYKQKCYFLKNWRDYIEYLHLSKTPIDRINPADTRDFGIWLKNKPKQTALHTGSGRSLELVNNNISEVIRMYHRLAKRDKYISENQIPEIDRVKMQLDEGYKRDVMNEEQYEKFWRWIQYKYITKKHNPSKTDEELEVRKIWKEFIFIMSNVGFRPSELLGIKLYEITENPQWDDARNATDVLMKVRKENSKTGRARVCVAPVKKRIERVLESYKKIGIEHRPDDFLFISHRWVVNGRRDAPSRNMMYTRLKKVMEESGLKDELEKEGKRISLYSFRHQYACWRLRYGDVPIHLLAKQMGTSIQKIESTYGHIEVEQQAELITKAQDQIKRTGYVLSQPEVIEDKTLESMQYQHTVVTKNSGSTNKKAIK